MRQVRVLRIDPRVQPVNAEVGDFFDWVGDNIVDPLKNAANEVIRFPGDTLNTANNAANQFVDWTFHAVNEGWDGAGDLITGALSLGLGVGSLVLGANGQPMPPPQPQPAPQQGLPMDTLLLVGGAAAAAYLLSQKK